MLDLDRQQAIFGAAGLGTIPSETLRQMSALTHWVTVFNGPQRKQGWVIPDQTFFNISSTEPRSLSNGYAAINKALRLSKWGERPLDRLIQTFSEYITTAQGYERDGRFEEALLHLVFGLDLLLGGEAGETLTNSLAERVALLTFVTLETSIEEVIILVKSCYGTRSSYVHRGEKGNLITELSTSGSCNLLDRLIQVCRIILGVACFARLQEWSHGGEARAAWLSRLDVLRAKNKADLPLEESDLASLGINKVVIVEGEACGIFLKDIE